jgi:hypothetical protein
MARLGYGGVRGQSAIGTLAFAEAHRGTAGQSVLSDGLLPPVRGRSGSGGAFGEHELCVDDVEWRGCRISPMGLL